jgi:hypothetical protein
VIQITGCPHCPPEAAGISVAPSFDGKRDSMEESGTRFRLYVQPPFVPGYEKPETIRLRAPAGSILAGPSNARLYCLDALDKGSPYVFPYLPPYVGAIGAAAEPSRDGHFDHLPVDTRPFASAQLFGSICHTLEVWEGYAGGHIPWHFERPRLEAIPLVEWDNAQAGYGFLETGFGDAPDGTVWPFALSLDVVAHEVGHLLLYTLVGLPDADRVTSEFGAFHESAADLVALVGLLQFDGVIELLIQHTKGNLFIDNELNRFAELSSSSEIRDVSNDLTLADMGEDPEIHHLSLVLTGAFFDILVEAFLLRLQALGVIDAEAVEAARATTGLGSEPLWLSARLAAACATRPALFHCALAEARDFLGRRLALTWKLLLPNDMTFGAVAGAFLAADARLSGDRRNRGWLASSFAWRGIVPVAPQTEPGWAVPYPYRRIPTYPEPYELEHRCAVRWRRHTQGWRGA